MSRTVTAERTNAAATMITNKRPVFVIRIAKATSFPVELCRSAHHDTSALASS